MEIERESWQEFDYRKMLEIDEMYEQEVPSDAYPTILVEIIHEPMTRIYGTVRTRLMEARPDIHFIQLNSNVFKSFITRFKKRQQPLYVLYNGGIIRWKNTPDEWFPNDDQHGTVIPIDGLQDPVFYPHPELLIQKLIDLLAQY